MDPINHPSVKLYWEFVRRRGTYACVDGTLPHISGFTLKQFLRYLQEERNMAVVLIKSVLWDLELCYETALGFNPLCDVTNEPLTDLLHQLHRLQDQDALSDEMTGRTH